MSEESNPEQLKIYRDRVLEPATWVSVAQRMYVAAGLVEPYVAEHWNAKLDAMFDDAPEPETRWDVQMVHFMLTAMVLENLFKAAIVRDGIEVPDDKPLTQLPGELKSHNLLTLAKRAQYSTRQEDEELLVRLSDACVWQGRYPAPVKIERWGAVQLPKGGKALPGRFGSFDTEKIHGLVTHVCQALGFQLQRN